MLVKFWIRNLMIKPKKPYDTTPRLDHFAQEERDETPDKAPLWQGSNWQSPDFGKYLLICFVYD